MLFFYALFMGPLVILAWGTYDLIWQIEYNHMPIPDSRVLALRFLIAVPLATISTFGFASLRLYRKLYEQYNHKQRVMELYLSFKREIEATGDDEQKKRLLTIMLDSVAEKAWQITKPDAEEKDDGGLLNLEKFVSVATRVRTAIGGS
jgi:ABC-type multidrug transport system fused ATPase/permease subunit